VQIATTVGQVACWNLGIWIDIGIGIKELTKECWPSSMELGRYMDWYWSWYERTDQRVLVKQHVGTLVLLLVSKKLIRLVWGEAIQGLDQYLSA
jgi:hypothetical protein